MTKRDSAAVRAAKYRKAIRGLKIAESILNYVRGDDWERECFAKDRARFNKIYEDLTGQEGGA